MATLMLPPNSPPDGMSAATVRLMNGETSRAIESASTTNLDGETRDNSFLSSPEVWMGERSASELI
jgi:hypothetical protein